MKSRLSLLLTILVISAMLLGGCRRVVVTDSSYIDEESYYYLDVEVTNDGTNSTTGGRASSNTTTTRKGATTTAKKLEETDIKGIPAKLNNPKITLMSWYDPGSEDKTTPFYWAVQKYQELYGKNTVYLVLTASADGYKEKVTAALAGGDTPELLEVKTHWMPSFAIENILQPVDGKIDYKSLHYQGLVEAASWNGKHYVGCPNGMWSHVIWYNETLFKKYNVKTPKEYYKEGKWTWDNFVKAARDMTFDDIWGFSTDALDTLVRSQKTGFVTKNNDGTMTITWKKPEVLRALQVTHDMIYKYKCWNPDLTYTSLNFKKQKLAMSSGVIGFKENYAKGMTDTISCVPLPKPTENSEHYGGAYGIFWGIGKGCDNLDGAIAFLKILAQYEDKNYGNRTPLEQSLTEEELNITRSISEKSGVMVHLSLSSWDPYEFWKEFSTSNKPVATLLDTYEPIVQKAIGELYKQ